MTVEDLDVQLTIDGSLLDRRVERSLVLGPRSRMGELWVRLLRRDVATVRAVISEAFGREMPSACPGCEDGPFPLCVAESNDACSNCIYTGSARFCPWKRRGDDSAVGKDGVNEGHEAMDQDSHDSVNEKSHDAIDEDHPPKMQRVSSPPTEHFHVPPRTRHAGRRRRNPDSDPDPDFVPPKKRRPDGPDYMDGYDRQKDGMRVSRKRNTILRRTWNCTKLLT